VALSTALWPGLVAAEASCGAWALPRGNIAGRTIWNRSQVEAGLDINRVAYATIDAYLRTSEAGPLAGVRLNATRLAFDAVMITEVNRLVFAWAAYLTSTLVLIGCVALRTVDLVVRRWRCRWRRLNW
jgi:hypothetical protein